MTIDDFAQRMERDGFAIIPGLLAPDFVEELRRDLELAYCKCREIQVKNGVDVNTDGTVHHVLPQARSFLDLFERAPIFIYAGQFFGAPFIVNTYGGVINLPNKPSYVCRVHRDIRSFSGGVPTMLNLLVMLDDFTAENGATWLLPGGHRASERPDDRTFYQNASRAKGPAGSLVFFDSNLWHAAGENKTGSHRRALTIAFTRPFYKQQLDYPRALGYGYCESLPEHLKQIVGYYARVPESLEEWYQPVERRFYARGQG